MLDQVLAEQVVRLTRVNLKRAAVRAARRQTVDFPLVVAVLANHVVQFVLLAMDAESPLTHLLLVEPLVTLRALAAALPAGVAEFLHAVDDLSALS